MTKGVLVVFVILAITTSIVSYIYVKNFTSGMTILNLPGAPVWDAAAGQESVGIGQLAGSPGVATPEPWDGKSRVTLLIMGLDYRDWEAGMTPHSDTMILLSLDPLTATASMLSLPRDMWVNIPGFDFGRINEAYFNGEAFNLPGGGPELARQTVEQFIGIPIQYYAVIDFNAFIRFIDEIGGVSVTPKQYVTIEKFGGSQQETLEPGKTVTLDGALALAYARERHTEGGDVDRARRQQQIILSIKKRILKFENIPNLVAKAPALYQEISSGIGTNLNFQEAIQLGLLALQVDTNNIKKGVIDYSMVIPTKSPQGEQILKPIPDKIRILRDELFAGSGTGAPIAVPAENSTLVRDEAATVVIWDGGGQSGLGERTSSYLQSQGINVIQVADAGSYYPATKIEIFNGKPYTAAFLAKTMGVASANIWNTYDPNAGVDIRITLGGDWAANNQLP
ncbi:MAG: LCP family protein, partial [Anaerolineaceae bacterium]|nr:LCP family protein [Anaerolineaceae bacterium]